jgi:cytochrome P450
VDINLITPETMLDPFPQWEEVRKLGRIVYSDPMKCWLVPGHADCQTILTDTKHFSNTVFASTDFGPWFEGTLNMIVCDPPDHTRLRGQMQRAFTRQSVMKLEPRIKQLVQELLDNPEFADRMNAGEAPDAVSAFTSPLPSTVIAELLGVPVTDRAMFAAWSESMINAIVADPNLVDMSIITKATEAGHAMLAYLKGQLDERLRTGDERDDLMGSLLRENANGELSDDELAATCVLLLIAGNETTANTTATALELLAKHPDQRVRVVADPSLLPRAVEEVLRYDPTARLNFRKVMDDCPFADAQLGDGDTVWLILGAANRDPDRFENPAVFDVGRTPNPMLTFGYGPHLCLGAQLARMEIRHAVQGWLQRWPDFELVKTERGPGYAVSPTRRLHLAPTRAGARP